MFNSARRRFSSALLFGDLFAIVICKFRYANYYLMKMWRCGNVAVAIISAGHEYTANKIDHRSSREAPFPQGSITSSFFGKLARTHPPAHFPRPPPTPAPLLWEEFYLTRESGGNQVYYSPARQKNRYPNATCVGYLIRINGHEPMTVVWDTIGIPHKKESIYVQVTYTTFVCTVLLVGNTNKSRVTS